MFVATAAVGGGLADLEFLQAQTTATSAGTLTFTFNSVNIGTAFADRHVIVCIGVFGAVGVTSLTSVTIGGVAATIHASSTLAIAATKTQIVAIAGRSIAAGTSTTVVVTLSGSNMSVCFCRVYTLHRYRSATVTDGQGTTASNAGSVADTIDIPASGVLLVTALNAASTGSCSMLGVSEDADQNVGNVNCCTGSLDGLGAEVAGPYAVQEVGAANTPEWVMAAAVWH
jgi:hypothetical protein